MSSLWIRTSGLTSKIPDGFCQGTVHFSLLTSQISRLTLAFLALVLLPIASALAVTPQELLTNPPKRYFNDYAQMVTPATAAFLESELENFERETSNQILVVIFPTWPDDLVFDDYAQSLYRAAKIGQAGKDNGVLLLLTKGGKIRIHTGRGLEGALPDALCIRIIRDDFAPQFRAGNYDESLKQGLAAIIAAAKGEYKGNGKTVAEQNSKKHSDDEGWLPIVVFILIFLFFMFISMRRRGVFFGGGPGGGFFMGGGGGDRGGGGGGDGGGDDGFSGGGGDSGGGGASDQM
ncbi:MAG: TPM domain-containing protein [Verrucomicrobia bacterium]|nr:TPM domain-containing protein [Verrucomicrobiota bacterium]